MMYDPDHALKDRRPLWGSENIKVIESDPEASATVTRYRGYCCQDWLEWWEMNVILPQIIHTVKVPLN